MNSNFNNNPTTSPKMSYKVFQPMNKQPVRLPNRLIPRRLTPSNYQRSNSIFNVYFMISVLIISIIMVLLYVFRNELSINFLKDEENKPTTITGPITATTTNDQTTTNNQTTENKTTTTTLPEITIPITPPITYSMYSNTDYTNQGDLMKVIGTINECGAECDKTPNCNGFVYNTTNNTCYLKNIESTYKPSWILSSNYYYKDNGGAAGRSPTTSMKLDINFNKVITKYNSLGNFGDDHNTALVIVGNFMKENGINNDLVIFISTENLYKILMSPDKESAISNIISSLTSMKLDPNFNRVITKYNNLGNFGDDHNTAIVIVGNFMKENGMNNDLTVFISANNLYKILMSSDKESAILNIKSSLTSMKLDSNFSKVITKYNSLGNFGDEHNTALVIVGNFIKENGLDKNVISFSIENLYKILMSPDKESAISLIKSL